MSHKKRKRGRPKTKNHLLQKRPMTEVTKKKISENNKIFSLCKICKKQCHGFRGMVDHMHKDHTDYKPWRCHLCDERTAFVKTLYRHLKTKHDVDRAPCPACSKVYTRSQSMRVHVNTIHQDFLNRDNDQPIQEDNNNAMETEMVCDNDLFQLISISIDNLDFCVAQPEEPQIDENINLDGDHYQVNGSVIRYCRK